MDQIRGVLTGGSSHHLSLPPPTVNMTVDHTTAAEEEDPLEVGPDRDKLPNGDVTIESSEEASPEIPAAHADPTDMPQQGSIEYASGSGASGTTPLGGPGGGNLGDVESSTSCSSSATRFEPRTDSSSSAAKQMRTNTPPAYSVTSASINPQKNYFRVSNVALHAEGRGEWIPCTLKITQQYVELRSKDTNQVVLSVGRHCVFWVQMFGSKGTTSPNGYGLELYCRNVAIYVISFPAKDNTRSSAMQKLKENMAKTMVEAMMGLYQPPRSVSTGSNGGGTNGVSSTQGGWFAVDMRAEMARQGVFEGVGWRFTEANRQFDLCATYGPELVVPDNIQDYDLRAVAKERSRSRVHVLTYFDRRSRTALLRCSQPAASDPWPLSSSDSTDCLRLIKEVAMLCPRRRLIIHDLRPFRNALGNKVFMHGGYSAGNEDADVAFDNIANIHEVRSSYNRLFALCTHYRQYESYSGFATALQESMWLDHVQSLLQAADQISSAMTGEDGKGARNVVVHCSDGWDRTSQVAALVQLLMDPYFRTMKGFLVLLDKDFVYFGHQFRLRNDVNVRDGCGSTGQDSPVFLQFFDAVFQVMHQYPTAFEFTPELLIAVIDAYHDCTYGNFAFDSFKELVESGATEKTPSLWPALLDRADAFRNPLYGLCFPQRQHCGNNTYGFAPAPIHEMSTPLDQRQPSTSTPLMASSPASPAGSAFASSPGRLRVNCGAPFLVFWGQFFLRGMQMSAVGVPAMYAPQQQQTPAVSPPKAVPEVSNGLTPAPIGIHRTVGGKPRLPRNPRSSDSLGSPAVKQPIAVQVSSTTPPSILTNARSYDMLPSSPTAGGHEEVEQSERQLTAQSQYALRHGTQQSAYYFSSGEAVRGGIPLHKAPTHSTCAKYHPSFAAVKKPRKFKNSPSVVEVDEFSDSNADMREGEDGGNEVVQQGSE